MLTRKLFLSALGVVVSGGLGICAQLVGVTLLVAVPTLLVLAAGCIAAAAVLIRGTRKWAPHPVFQGNGYDRHELKGVFWAVASAIAANALFVGFWVAQPTLWPLWLSLIAVMAAATYFGARSHAYARENMRRNPAEIVPKAAATPAASTAQAQPGAAPGQTASAPHPGQEYALPNFKAVLRRANLAQTLAVSSEYEPVRDHEGATIGARFFVRVPSRLMKADGTSPLTAAHGAIIAGAMEELSEADPHSDAIDVDPSRVVVRKLPKAASRYKITLIDQDVMGRVFPYWNRDTSPKSITTPAPIGYTAEGQLYSRALRKHSSDVGESTSGKTSLIQVEWAWTTLCEDEVDWIVGTEKVYDGVGAWLEPYRGRDEPVPFDLIAVGPEDATLTIAMGIALARWRQAQDFAVRETFKTVIIRLDEATGLLTHPHAFAVYDGALMDASALAAHGTNGTAGGGGKVYFKLAAQRGTQDRWGKSGGSINANISDQTVFRSGEQSELGRAFNDWKLPMPDRPGMCWINSGDNDLQLIKSMYIQSVDADQPVLHDGPNLSQVAAGRSHIAKGLDKASAEFLGEWYANRRTRADDLIPYVKAITSDLQGVDPYQTAKGIGAPAAGGKSGQATAASNTAHEQSTTAAPIKAPPGVDMNNPLIAQAAREVAAEMEQVDREFGLTGEQQPELEQAPPPTMTPTFVTPGPPPKTREQKVLAIVRDAEEPPGRAAILQRLRDDYGDDKASPQLVTNALNALVSKQIIARNDDTNTYIVEGTTA